MPIRPALLFTLGLLSGLTPFAIDMYLPALPAIAADLGSSIELAQLTLTVYLAVYALAQLFLGPLADMLGRRVVIGAGLVLFSIGCVGCALAPTMDTLIGARALAALGGAGIAVTVPALIRDLFERDHYARVFGLVMLTMSLAPLVAPTVGGLIVARAGWPWVFAALIAIALVAGLLYARLIPETLPPARRHPADLGRVLRNYLKLLRHRAGLGYLLTGSAIFGGMMVFITTAPYVYMSLYGIPTEWFGLLFGINVMAAMVGTTINTRLVTRLGAEHLLGIGLLLQAVASLGLLALVALGHPPLWLIIACVLLYLGLIGLVMGNAMAGFMAHFAPMAGTASAFYGAARFGTGALAGTLVSLVHDGTARPMLVGMGLCGLLAGFCYARLCRA